MNWILSRGASNRLAIAAIVALCVSLPVGLAMADHKDGHAAGGGGGRPGGGGGPGGGGPGGGSDGGSESLVCADPEPSAGAGADIVTICFGDESGNEEFVTYEKRWRDDIDVNASDGIDSDEQEFLTTEQEIQTTFVTDIGVASPLGATPNQIRGGWESVFNEEFEPPPSEQNNDLRDYSGSLNYRRWSTKYPFSSDAKSNTIPGEDDHWNVNTTGRYPGIGPTLSNFYNNPSQTDFLDQLFGGFGGNDPSYPVFDIVNSYSDGGESNALQITSYRNPNPVRRINKNKKYLSGLITSSANPDGVTPKHGFEFRYGYVESRLRLPLEGNGMRAALWLYSDNFWFNVQSDDNKIKHEIDIMEYLPNTIKEPGYSIQDVLFGGVNNAARPDSQKIMTYDTIFMTYHSNDFNARTPSNWTFNSEDRYRSRRSAAFNCDASSDGSPCAENFEFDNQWVKVGLLWQPTYIEWYVEDVLIHRVTETGDGIPGFEHVAPVFDKRMYILANLAMGLDVFEGGVDDSLFNSLPSGGEGPSFAVDYIKVWQNNPNAEDPDSNSHVSCGYQLDACDTTVGIF